MYCLAIDTTSKFLCIAVIKNEQVIGQYNKIHDRQHSVLLLSLIEKVLCLCGISANELDCLAVDIGPGSFTGLRIGIATVKGLSMSLNKPVIGLCSLELIAAAQAADGAIICPVIDAKRQQVYSAVYKSMNNKITRQGGYFLGPIDELLKGLKGKVIFCGDALLLYKDKIKTAKNINPAWAKEKAWFPNPVSFSKLCYKMFKEKKFNKSEQITPMYLYQNACTVRKKKKKS